MSTVPTAWGFASEQNGEGVDGGFCASDGPILPPAEDMAPEEGFSLRGEGRAAAARGGRFRRQRGKG